MGRRVDCIKRLIEVNHSYNEMCEWLIENKFTNDISAKVNSRITEKAEFIYKILKENETNGNIMLLYFEWSILPTESIKITCVTQTEEKLFTYGL